MRDFANEAGKAFENAVDEAKNPNTPTTISDWAAIAQAAASIATFLEVDQLRRAVEKIAAKP